MVAESGLTGPQDTPGFAVYDHTGTPLMWWADRDEAKKSADQCGGTYGPCSHRKFLEVSSGR